MGYTFTSESVTEGHPDKVCDQISDAILDATLDQYPDAHVACETFVTGNDVFVMGEFSKKPDIDIVELVRNTIRTIGYTDPKIGFDYKSCHVHDYTSTQSSDIAQGVNLGCDIGAGDQGMVFGYACNETSIFMPMAISLAHELVQNLDCLRHSISNTCLRPDGKSQVAIKYDDSGKPYAIDSIVLSSQHAEDVDQDALRIMLMDEVIMKTISDTSLDASDVDIYINPTGRFCIGGPVGDTGLTGRKIVVDTYGGYARHGGGAFSGKDPTKMDRSGAYMARYIAKHIVAAELADKCELQMAYAIGVPRPISIYLDTSGTNHVDISKIIDAIPQLFDLSVKGVIDTLQLRRPIYSRTSVYGHFGKSELPWEILDSSILEQLKTLL